MTVDLLGPMRRRVALLEAAAADALAAEEDVVIDGWRLRANGGIARRANSALPEQRGRGGLGSKIDEVVAFYRARTLPARFQLAPAAAPAGLDARLARRGWVREEGAWVMTRSLTRPWHADPQAPDGRVEITNRPTDTWLHLTSVLAPDRSEWMRRRSERVAPTGRKVWHLVAHDRHGEPVTTGMAVLDVDRRLVGLFDLATREDARRAGHARRLVVTTLERARAAGIVTAYLQVGLENLRAIRLYRRLGFRDAYPYHYRREPDSG